MVKNTVDYPQLAARGATIEVLWKGQKVVATFEGLQIGDAKNGGVKTVALPNSSGTHVARFCLVAA